MQQTWEQLLWTPHTARTTIANSATEAILVPNATVFANTLYAGGALRCWGYGAYGTTTGPPNLQFRVRWGGVAGTIIAATSNIATTASTGGGASMTNLLEWDFTVQCRTAGSSGSVFTNGRVTLWTSATAATVYALASGSTGGTTPAAVTVDTTTDQALAVTAQWGTANAANSVAGDQRYDSSLN